MTNQNERFFRMLSIAILGLCALAFVPDSQATSPYASIIDGDSVVLQTAVLPVEVQVVREVEEINAGRFNPAVMGESQAFALPSPLKTTTISSIDPNL